MEKYDKNGLLVVDSPNELSISSTSSSRGNYTIIIILV